MTALGSRLRVMALPTTTAKSLPAARHACTGAGTACGVADGGIGGVQVRRQPPPLAARHLHGDGIDGVKVHARACARLITKERALNMLRRHRERRGDRFGQRCERWRLSDVKRDAALIKPLRRLRRHEGSDMAAVEALEPGDHRRRMTGEEIRDVPRRQRQSGASRSGVPARNSARLPKKSSRKVATSVGANQASNSPWSCIRVLLSSGKTEGVQLSV